MSAGSATVELTPCIGICTLDPESGFCRGCCRTVAEITAWRGLDAAARRQVMAALPGRRERVQGGCSETPPPDPAAKRP